MLPSNHTNHYVELIQTQALKMDSQNTFDKNHRPVHPLPEDILKMKRDETVCKFCGVSYLIHSEIKALEDKIAKLEAKLKDYDLIKEKEKQFNLIAEEQNLKIDELDKKLTIKSQMISSLNNDLEQRQLEATRLNNKLKEFESENSLLTATNENLKKKLFSFDSITNTTKLSISQQKSALKAVELLVQNQNKNFNEAINEIQRHIKMFSNKEFKDKSEKDLEIESLKLKEAQIVTENSNLKNEINSLNKQIDSLKVIKEELNSKLNLYNNELTKMGSMNDLLLKSENEKRDLMDENMKLKDKFFDLETKYRNSNFELNEMLSRNKSIEKELTILRTNIANLQSKYTNDTQNLEKELKTKTDELNFIKDDYEKTRKALKEKEKIFENEMLTNSQVKLNEIGQMNSQIKAYQQRISDLESERNAMTLAHQCQIAQLKDSFKERMKSNEGWPEKLAFELNKEREKHNEIVKILENDLKQNFQMEFEIQEQKYKEMIAKYKTDLNDNESKTRIKLSQIENENFHLKEQLKLLHDEKISTEDKYKNELDNLREITRDLHERLEKYSNGEVDSEILMKFKEDCLIKDNKIHDLNANIESIEKQLTQAKDEVKLLQETVHHECLERQELHDKLEQTREELLNLKKATYSQAPQFITLTSNATNNGFVKSPNNGANRLIDVNSNPVRLSNEVRASISRSPSDSLASASQPLPPLQYQQQMQLQSQQQHNRKLNYNETLSRSSQMLNSNTGGPQQQQQNQIQLFQKINRLQQKQQQLQQLQKANGDITSAASTPPGTGSNASANNLYTDNKRRLSLLLARKS